MVLGWYYDWSRESRLDDRAVTSCISRLLTDVVLPAGWISATARIPGDLAHDIDDAIDVDDEAARTLGATSLSVLTRSSSSRQHGTIVQRTRRYARPILG